jgi:1-acyl-sn-glycerol-3-phosphate acyltransferase
MTAVHVHTWRRRLGRTDQATNPRPVPYRLAKSLLGPVLRRCWHIEVDGVKHLPTQGPFIVAANHQSFMDSVFLALVAPGPIRFVAKAEYFDRWPSAWMFRALGQIPLRRGSSAAAVHALAAARVVLAENGIVGIYPEGTRSRDGKLHRGSSGPVRLAMRSGAPIVPVGLIGTDTVQAPGETLPHLFREVVIRVGAPQHVPSAGEGCSRKTILRGATDELMQTIAELSGQERAQP